MPTPGFITDFERLMQQAAEPSSVANIHLQNDSCVHSSVCYSFEHFKHVYASLNFSIVHHGVLLSRKASSKNQKCRAQDEATARAVLQDNFGAILDSICRTCGVVHGSRKESELSNIDAYLASKLLRPLKENNRTLAPPDPPLRAIIAMYALYCLHQTQVLVPAEPVRVTPYMLALLVRLERRLLLKHFISPCGAAAIVTSLLNRHCFCPTVYSGAARYSSIDLFASSGGFHLSAGWRGMTNGEGSGSVSSELIKQLRKDSAHQDGVVAEADSITDRKLIQVLIDQTDDASYL